MEENSKHTAKMKENLHPNLEEASGMAPKLRMFEELRRIEQERRKRVEMERVEREEQAKQALERKHLERDKLEEKEEDVEEMCGNNLPGTSQNTKSQAKPAWLEKDTSDDEHFTEDGVKTSGSTTVTSLCSKKDLEYKVPEPGKEEQTEQLGLSGKDELSDAGVAKEDGVALQDQKPIKKKVTFNKKVEIRTYQSEAEEGSEPYLLLATGTASVRDSPLTNTRADHERVKVMVTEKQRQKIEDCCNLNQAKHTAGVEEVVQKQFEQLSHTGGAEEEGDVLQDQKASNKKVTFNEKVQIRTYQRDDRWNWNHDLKFKENAFNWLNYKVKKRNLKKIELTFQREAEEGSEPYLPLVRCMPSICDSPLLTRADRERAKREKLMLFEEQRQKVEDRWNQNQAKRAERKKALKIREEERYERWSVKRWEWLNQSIGDDEHFLEDRVDTSGSTTAKKRMSIWQKRYLRINCLTG